MSALCVSFVIYRYGLEDEKIKGSFIKGFWCDGRAYVEGETLKKLSRAVSVYREKNGEVRMGGYIRFVANGNG